MADRTHISDIRAAFRPDAKARLFDEAVNADTDLFTEDLEPTAAASSLRLLVAVDTATVLNVQETQDATTVEYAVNSGDPIDAGQGFFFSFPVRDAATYNFQVDTAGTIRVLNVDEVPTTVIG